MNDASITTCETMLVRMGAEGSFEFGIGGDDTVTLQGGRGEEGDCHECGCRLNPWHSDSEGVEK